MFSPNFRKHFFGGFGGFQRVRPRKKPFWPIGFFSKFLRGSPVQAWGFRAKRKTKGIVSFFAKTKRKRFASEILGFAKSLIFLAQKTANFAVLRLFKGLGISRNTSFFARAAPGGDEKRAYHRIRFNGRNRDGKIRLARRPCDARACPGHPRRGRSAGFRRSPAARAQRRRVAARDQPCHDRAVSVLSEAGCGCTSSDGPSRHLRFTTKYEYSWTLRSEPVDQDQNGNFRAMLGVGLATVWEL